MSRAKIKNNSKTTNNNKTTKTAKTTKTQRQQSTKLKAKRLSIKLERRNRIFSGIFALTARQECFQCFRHLSFLASLE